MAEEKGITPATRETPKGRWLHRFAVHFFTVALGILVFWLLGFLVEDIRTMPGPDYGRTEKKHVDAALSARAADLQRQIAELDRVIGQDRQRQRILQDSSQSLQQTIAQIRAVEKPLSSAEEEASANALSLFLENQHGYQALNQAIAERTDRREALSAEREHAVAEIEKGRERARAEHGTLLERHRLRLAFLQLGLLAPVLAVACIALLKKRGSPYAPLFYAFGGASLLKATEVVHEYFPTRLFKYVLILALIAAVGRLLIHFIQAIRSPKVQWLLKQYREAYERFLCPICEYPIRTGPRRFLYWTRRTVNKAGLPTGQAPVEEEPYTCPACGSGLFEPCGSCRKVRHTLLPHCAHCGAAKQAV